MPIDIIIFFIISLIIVKFLNSRLKRDQNTNDRKTNNKNNLVKNNIFWIIWILIWGLAVIGAVFNNETLKTWPTAIAVLPFLIFYGFGIVLEYLAVIFFSVSIITIIINFFLKIIIPNENAAFLLSFTSSIFIVFYFIYKSLM
jgi:hypothetical protein